MKIIHGNLHGALGNHGVIECIQINIGDDIFFIYITDERMKMVLASLWWHGVARFKLKPKRTRIISDIRMVNNNHSV